MSSFVFIDSRVEDLDSLLAGLVAGVQAVVLDPTRDGVAQIAAALEGASDLDSIHIVSHGSSGTLHLGSTVLTEENLDQYQTPLAQIGASLSDVSDLLLYGCDVGAGSSGQSFIASLAARTGADVAASTDATGSPLLGANWLLETATGAIELPASFSAPAQDAYPHTLGAPYLTPAGTLDTTFGGGDGKVTIGIFLKGIALQPDGKIVGFGYDNLDFAITRLHTDGSLDTLFGEDGTAFTDFTNSVDLGNAFALQSDGKMLLAGTTYSRTSDDADFALARYNADGSLDTTFDGDGRLTTDFGDLGGLIGNYIWRGEANSMALQADGKILVAGWWAQYWVGEAEYYYPHFAMARYQVDGTLDTTFDGDGLLTDVIGGSEQIILQPDGKILVVGHESTSIPYQVVLTLVRYNADGSLDTSFGQDGEAATVVSNIFGGAIALQTDGKILVAGSSLSSVPGNEDFALARYNTDGSLDTTFDGDGKVTTDFTGTRDYINAIALQSDGRIVVAGSTFNLVSNENFAAARYNPDGSLDTTFDGDGKLTNNAGGDAVAIQSDGGILFTRLDVLGGGLPDHTQAAGSAFNLAVASNHFTDPDGDPLTYTAALSGGSAMPAWLAFDSATRTFSGTPPAGELATYSVQVTATDAEGLSASDTFLLSIGPSGAILGTSQNDWLVGTGNDVIAAFMGNDSIVAGDGDDWVHGNQGRDTLYGGLGNDELRGGNDDDYVQGNQGNDTIFGSVGNDELRGGNDNDFVQGNQGNDTIFGSLGNDELRGGNDNDYVQGNQGNDTLFGSIGNDELRGGNDDDLLLAGEGNDTLIGSFGNDLLTAGPGLDQFWFNSAGAANADTITDFGVGGEADTLVLAQFVFTALMPGALDAGRLVSGAGVAAADGDDYILYDTATGNLSYDADGNGGGAALLIATLTGAPALTAAGDFLIVA